MCFLRQYVARVTAHGEEGGDPGGMATLTRDRTMNARVYQGQARAVHELLLLLLLLLVLLRLLLFQLLHAFCVVFGAAAAAAASCTQLEAINFSAAQTMGQHQ